MKCLQSGIRAVILMYHRVGDGDVGDPELCLPIATFRSHMHHLHDEGCEVVSLTEMRRRLSDGSLRDGSVAITFDDGYVEMLSVVAPIMAEFGYPSTTFVVGRALTRTIEFWWDTLYRLLRGQAETPPSLTIDVLDRRLQLPTCTAEERELSRRSLSQILYKLPHTSRDAAVSRLLEWSGGNAAEGNSSRPLVADELLKLSRLEGFDIGSHTEDHVWLPAETPLEQRFQMEHVNARLKHLLGYNVSSFAYPYGAWDETTVGIVRATGYNEAVTTFERAATSIEEFLLLPRINAGRQTNLSLKESLSPYWHSDAP